MRRFIAAISIILTASGAVPALAQTFGDMDSSGRFGGMPPGTDRLPARIMIRVDINPDRPSRNR